MATKTNPFTAKAKKKDNPFTKKATTKPPKAHKNPLVQKQLEHKRKLEAESDQRDFTRDGVKLGEVREHDGYWTIKVTNGDESAIFHNRFGSWMMNADGLMPDVSNANGHLKEPAKWLTPMLHERWLVEMSKRGIPVPRPGDKRDNGKGK